MRRRGWPIRGPGPFSFAVRVDTRRDTRLLPTAAIITIAARLIIFIWQPRTEQIHKSPQLRERSR